MVRASFAIGTTLGGESPPARSTSVDSIAARHQLHERRRQAIWGGDCETVRDGQMWGRGFWPDPDGSGFPGVYDEGLLDQVVRAQQLGRADTALDAVPQAGATRPGGESDARVLESLRMLHKREDAVEYSVRPLARTPVRTQNQRRARPVRARRRQRGARERPARAAWFASFQTLRPPAPLRRPCGDWPRDLNAMTASPTDQAGRAR